MLASIESIGALSLKRNDGPSQVTSCALRVPPRGTCRQSDRQLRSIVGHWARLANRWWHPSCERRVPVADHAEQDLRGREHRPTDDVAVRWNHYKQPMDFDCSALRGRQQSGQRVHCQTRANWPQPRWWLQGISVQGRFSVLGRTNNKYYYWSNLLSCQQVIHHEHFIMNEQTGRVLNDVALIKLSNSIDFKRNSDLEPVCLATSASQLTSTCIASGFGNLNFNEKTETGTQSSHLNKVSEPQIETSHCTRVFPYFDAKTMVCAGGSQRGGTGTCQGDSGGPLQCKGSDGKFYQIGIVSYGDPCGHANIPDAFTKVSAFVDWIKTTISRNWALNHCLVNYFLL